MAYNTIIQQGTFTSDGARTTITLRSGVDWMETINYTKLAAGGAGEGVKYYWQRGFAADAAIEYVKLAADDSMSPVVITTAGFTYIDTSASPLGAINATVTGISNAAIPIVSATSTAGLVAGDIVRFVDVTGAQQFGGVDFTIDTIVANTSFRLVYAPQIVAGTNGSFYPIKWDPIYYPRRRFISSISQAASAVVELTVTHGYTVGQEVRFVIPAAYGMVGMDGLSGTVTGINTTLNTVTVDIDSSGFTAFAFPLTADVPFTPAQMVPIGESTDSASLGGIALDDATENIAIIGMRLGAGTDGPAGESNDVIYWRAGKSFANVT